MKTKRSFRALYQEYMQLLKRETGFRDTLMDREHKEAFDLLCEEVWPYDEDLMTKAGGPGVMDVLNLLANIHVKHSTEELRKKLVELERKIKTRECQSPGVHAASDASAGRGVGNAWRSGRKRDD